MKCFTFLLFVVCLTGSFFISLPSVSMAETTEKTIDIKSIVYSAESAGVESITFTLSDKRAPVIFRLQGDNPRLVVDIPLSLYKGANVIAIDNGTLAHGIRVGVHNAPAMKTRTVIDLANDYDIKYEKIFSEQGTVLTIALSATGVKIKQTAEKVKLPIVDEKISVVKEKTAKNEKAVPPVFARKEPVAELVKKETVEKTVEVIDSDTGPQLLEVSFDDSSNKGEMVIFRLNDFYPPSVSAIEKQTPRVICDFMNMKLAADVNEMVVANGKYVERIRSVQHKNPDKVRVVLDLSPDRDYDLQQVFFKNDNLFVLIVNELPAELVKD